MKRSNAASPAPCFPSLPSRLVAGCALICGSVLAMEAAAAQAPSPLAATLAVANCNDSGTGSLRDTVAQADSGDTIDLTQAGCSRIDLAGEPIEITQDDLAILGPGRAAMAVDGNDSSPVFRHAGTGTLRVAGVAIVHGANADAGADGNIEGGCISSAGNISLMRSSVRYCTLYPGSDTPALGAGIYAAANVTLLESAVLDNRIVPPQHPLHGFYQSRGAGLYSANGDLRVSYSQIARNGGGNRNASGGATVGGDITAASSTIAGNVGLGLSGGGDVMVVDSTLSGNGWGAAAARNALVLVSSTVSGNTSRPDAGYSGVAALALTISNSTIVHNNVNSPSDACSDQAAVLGVPIGPTIHLDSSIIADNTCNGQPGVDVAAWTSEPLAVTGADNLVLTAPGVILPADTLSVEPGLSPLANHGGGRRTHALQAGSPAIDAGNNAAGLAWDQRGNGFPRTKGAQTDIGAYEY